MTTTLDLWQWLGSFILPVAGTWGTFRFFGERFLDSKLKQAELRIASEQAHQLERFKSDLTLVTEVRRQVAARRVEAALELWRLGEPLIRVSTTVTLGDPGEREETERAHWAFAHKLRVVAILFEEDTERKILKAAADIMAARTKADTTGDPEALAPAHVAYVEMLNLIRQELGVTKKVERDQSIVASRAA